MSTATATAKEQVMEMLRRLPDDVTLEDIECHVSVMTGLECAEARRVGTQAEQRMFKQQAIDLLGRLPDDVTLEEIDYEISFMADLHEGVRAADSGDVISHEEMLARSANTDISELDDSRLPRYCPLHHPPNLRRELKVHRVHARNRV
jgi:hypothetical protein